MEKFKLGTDARCALGGTAGVAVACKIPILASRVRLPGSAPFCIFFFPIMGSVRSLLFMVVRSCRTFYIAMVKPLISCFPILLLTHLYAAESQEVSKIPISFKDVQPKVGY